ncbi:MAG: Gfo/Idh/MocA family oxidoreductase [Salinivirgaceae bacterium]|jgi:predicted dehydrogenase|nr:Gfo/Idh/MocA family oxidoreductase [Salinivirgaceae bacterium]
MEKIKWGIIGCGDVTEVKSGPAFSLIEGSELVAVMRRDAGKAKDYAKRHKVLKWYSNADDLINDSEVNAIYVATPPNVHAEMAIKAIKARKPVYVEKPMALNYKECQEMIQASDKYQTPLFVAYYRRALPGFLKVKELVDSGVIGKVKFATIQLFKSLSNKEQEGDLPWRVDPKIAGGGHFFDLASHQLDYFNFLLGAVEKVDAVALNQTNTYKAEDIVSATFTMPNNVILSGKWCFTVPEFLESDVMEIVGSKGAIKFSCFGFNPVELITANEIETFEYEKPMHVQQPFIKLVVDELLGRKNLEMNANSAAQTNWVMDEVVKGFYK